MNPSFESVLSTEEVGGMTVLGIIFVLIVVLLALADPLLLSRFERLDEKKNGWR
ncbi:hypothetical protein GCM10009555_066800 [Acrocarpospora macrocephala]|uniref:Uncharacterized protein n=1 Tax=Acrocarpospora macrocephala TaxID=150177 RepID=A0A5M3WJ14_9ACTN|nr:hypothetical protein Amac_027710 [Acrocarpospora macrocephala]